MAIGGLTTSTAQAGGSLPLAATADTAGMEATMAAQSATLPATAVGYRGSGIGLAHGYYAAPRRVGVYYGPDTASYPVRLR